MTDRGDKPVRLCATLFAPWLVAFLFTTDVPGRFDSGVWQGNANFDEEGLFSDCLMTAEVQSGVLLGFVISKDFDWGLVIADETRHFEVGSVAGGRTRTNRGHCQGRGRTRHSHST